MTSDSWIHVAMTPAQAGEQPSECAVVIDALRATTTVVAMMEAGARSVTAAMEIGLARSFASERGAILAGEVNGLPPEGFDLGNSPVEAASAGMRDRDVVLFTTNGTKALCSAGAPVVVAGALTNLAAATRFISGHSTVEIVCAGNHAGARFALEDFAVAGAFVAALLQTGERSLNDEARVALGLVAGEGPAAATTASALMRESEHAAKTRALGLGKDIDYSSRVSISTALPVVVESGPGWVRLEDWRGGTSLDTWRG